MVLGVCGVGSPVLGAGTDSVVWVQAHVQVSEDQFAGVVGQLGDDRVCCDPVGQGLGPVVGFGLGSDVRWQPMFPVGEDAEEVIASGRVDVHGKKVIDDQQAGVAELVDQLLVSELITAGDHQLPGQFIHPGVDHLVLAIAEGDPDGAGDLGLTSSGG